MVCSRVSAFYLLFARVDGMIVMYEGVRRAFGGAKVLLNEVSAHRVENGWLEILSLIGY